MYGKFLNNSLSIVNELSFLHQLILSLVLYAKSFHILGSISELFGPISQSGDSCTKTTFFLLFSRKCSSSYVFFSNFHKYSFFFHWNLDSFNQVRKKNWNLKCSWNQSKSNLKINIFVIFSLLIQEKGNVPMYLFYFIFLWKAVLFIYILHFLLNLLSILIVVSTGKIFYSSYF